MKILSLAAIAATLISSQAFAQQGMPAQGTGDLSITDAWIRATVPTQKATGAFMHLRSTAGARIVDVKSTQAGLAQVHEMKMDGDVMKMRPLDALDLPAGKTVDLSPGGYHVMLMQLKQQLKPGDTVPLTLVVEGPDGKRQDVQLQVPVRPLNSAASAPMSSHGDMHMK